MGPASAGVVQVRCPSCQMTTMATPGQPSVCFSCGQPLPASVTGAAEAVPLFPLTGQLGESNLAPPPDPYGRSGGSPSKALIVGPPGQFPILPGAEVRVGRDASLCAVALSEPRVSGVHSTLKFEAACLWVRDEQSNNGTFIAGERIAPGAWTPVPPGRQLRFGPVEFDVRFET
jgi:FHA domain